MKVKEPGESQNSECQSQRRAYCLVYLQPPNFISFEEEETSEPGRFSSLPKVSQ